MFTYFRDQGMNLIGETGCGRESGLEKLVSGVTLNVSSASG